MAGIYIHIPFCKRKCIYCDFFSVAATPEKTASYLDALRAEYFARRAELRAEPVRTVYFGGGTPSLLPAESIAGVIEWIEGIADGAEITLEANPDDITADYAAAIRAAGVNRISMGAQSFSDKELSFLNRRHSARQAVQAVGLLRKAGFDNISVDLIYGIPGQTPKSWEATLRQAMELRLPHLSAYSLTYEEGTRLTRMRRRGDFSPCDDDLCVAFFETLADTAAANGYEQYEISNFAMPGMRSRHNSAYWDFTPYLGLGAAAHSFDGSVRRFNPSNLRLYTESVKSRRMAYSVEAETAEQLYNEWVMTRLRTSGGLDLSDLSARFGQRFHDYALKAAKPHVAAGNLRADGSTVALTRKGIMVSDMVFRDLFIVD